MSKKPSATLIFQTTNNWKFISALKEKFRTNKFFYTCAVDEERREKRYNILQKMITPSARNGKNSSSVGH